MRFEDIILEELDTNVGSDYKYGSYFIPATDELIEVTNKIRERLDYTDLVGVDYDNDVYYTWFLIFNINKKELILEAEVNHSEKDDFVCYNIELLPEEKEMLMWKVIKGLVYELENC